jgi:ribosomal protein S18 acetylase RimI-like enzyme
MASKLIRPGPTDYHILEKVSQIDCQAFGVDGISVFNLAQFARSGSVFALQAEETILAEAVLLKNFDNKGANVFGFAVNEQITSKGYGTELMSLLIDFAQNKGVSYFELTMNPDDQRARNFYTKKFKFIKKAALPVHPQKPEKRWLMHMDLNSSPGC